MHNGFVVHGLTCNYLENPIGLDSLPRFSWKIASDIRGQHQTAYRICIATSKENLGLGNFDAWDSGKLYSPQSILIEYNGKRLSPRTRYFWFVTVFDIEDKVYVSETAFFETGKLNEGWSAFWISDPNLDIEREETTHAAPMLRTAFELLEKPADARLYICGLGYYEAYLNGRKPSNDVLSPSFTRYDSTVLYNTYDVTDLIKVGKNALGVILGNGWYNCVTVDPWYTRQATWRHVPKLICELHVKLCDGSEHVIRSKPDWRTHKSPITFNSIRNGEHYDARLEIPDWYMPDFDDSSWDKAAVVRSPGGLLHAEELEPIRNFCEIRAVKKWQSPDKSWILDIGQNLSGIARVKVRGKAGTEVVIWHNEALREDGVSLVHEGGFIGSGEFQACRYIKKTDEEEVWQPRFVYFGFQYVEISGIDYEPELDDVTAVFIHTDLKRRGSFECSSDTLNSIMRITDWATLSNYHGLPTDCPHREKNGWIGDTGVSCEQTILNYAPMAAYTKWMHDFLDSQKPTGQIPCVVPSTGWGYNMWNGPDYSSTLTFIPWWLYVYCGDRHILSTCYDAIKKQCDFVLSMADDYIVCYGGGDWCAPFDGPAYFENMASFKAPKALTDTAYFHSMAKTLSKIAAILGKDDDKEKYAELSGKIKAAFRNKFFDRENMTVSGNCQTSTAFLLYHELCEKEEKEPLLNLLLKQIEEKNCHLDFGIFGSKAVMHTLGEEGHADIGFMMSNKTTYPSWGYWIQCGANTLWECWNGEGSHNHHMFGDVTAFFYKYLAGIAPDENEPGFRHIVLRPAINCGLKWVNGSHESMYGTIKCAWKNEDGKIKINISVPVGTHASLYLPADFNGRITEGGMAISDTFGISCSLVGGSLALSLTSGEYNFDIM